MKRMCELVEIAVNNEDCVVFRMKDTKTARMDLIALGCFKGDEEMIRMTKGRQPEITIWYQDGKSWCYHFGEGSTTVLNENGKRQREMIRECAILDFGIVCDWSYMNPDNADYRELVKKTSHVAKMEDAERKVTIVSGGNMVGHIRINEQHVASDVHVKDVGKWFQERGYEASIEGGLERFYEKGFPCGRVYGSCWPMEPVKEKALDAGFELSDSKRVAFVQERLGCNMKDAIAFIHEFHVIEEKEFDANYAMELLSDFSEDIKKAGLRVVDLTEDELAEIGRKVDSSIRKTMEYSAPLIDSRDICGYVVRLLKERQQHKVGELLDNARDVCENMSKENNGKVDVDFGK